MAKLDELTDDIIRTAKAKDRAYKLTDGLGLYLLVKPSGAKLWRLKGKLDGVEKTVALGKYPDIPLLTTVIKGKRVDGARDLRDNARRLLAAKVDPVAVKREDRQAAALKRADERDNTFGRAWDNYVRHKQAGWSANHRRDIERMGRIDVKPALGNIAFTKVNTANGQALIDEIVGRGAFTHAADVKLYVRAVFERENGQRAKRGLPKFDANPFDEIEVPDPPKVKHHARLPLDQVGRLLVDLAFADAEPITRIALRILLLTGLRTTELRLGRWSEIDEQAREWKVPETRTKTDIPHVVPLADETMAVLAQLRRISGAGPLMFPNVKNPVEPMSDSTVLALLYRMGLKGKMTGHGARGLLSTWANRRGTIDGVTRWTADAIERQLGHTEKNVVRASYNEYDFIDERRVLMREWAAWLTQQERDAQNVVSITDRREAA